MWTRNYIWGGGAREQKDDKTALDNHNRVHEEWHLLGCYALWLL
jgi:hypothetical protein